MKKFSIFFAGFFLFSFSTFAETYDYEVTAKKLDESRNNLSPKTGASSFSFSSENISNLPQGQATPLNQVLQRAPNVVVNSQNKVHVRGDHSGLQYRINGVMLPEGVNGFGQSLDTHFADSIDFLTGAMPAQYGLRTSGVVDIKTKSGSFDRKNRSELTVGSYDTFGANQQTSGSKGKLDYYLSATYFQSSRGIDSTTAARNSINNDTSQDNIFGYFSYLLEPAKKLSVIVSNSTNRFQVPANANQEAEFDLLNSTTGNSSDLREKQIEASRFAIASLQGVSDSDVDYQLSLFSRQSELEFKPDYESLVYSGASSSLDRSSFANGVQGDFSYKLNEKNTLRSGFYFVDDRVESDSRNFVFTGEHDDHGGGGHGHHDFDQDSNVPIIVDENSAQSSQFYSAYLQNEWSATDKLTINYGARFDASHAQVNESQLSPRLGATYDVSEKTTLHAGYARYFTPPSVASISPTTLAKFEETSNEAEVSQNDKVKAERSHYFDAGVSHKASKHLTLALDGYYKQSKNMLDEHQFGNSLLYSPFNYAEGKSYGLEFKADYQKDNFSSYFNLSTQRVYGRKISSAQYILHEEEFEYSQNNYVRADHAQNYTASLGASYIFSKTKFSADAIFGSGLSTGENNKNTMPSYWQINGAVSRDFAVPYFGKTNFRVAAINLLDEVYQYADGSGIGTNAAQFAQRRSFYLIASKSF
jgi:outer membrane receptor protein involved in Fe transport